MGRGLKGSLSEGAPHVEMVGMVVGSRHRDAAVGLMSNLVCNCGLGRGGSFVRIPHCGHTSCRCSQPSTTKLQSARIPHLYIPRSYRRLCLQPVTGSLASRTHGYL